MKKFEYLFLDEHDKVVIPILFRSMKETGFNCGLPAKKIIEICMASRKTHPSENYTTNISFWPKDLNYESYKGGGSFASLFISRLVNAGIIRPKDIITSFTINDNFICYLRKFDMERKKRGKEVYAALLKFYQFSEYKKALFGLDLNYFQKNGITEDKTILPELL